MAAAPWLGHHHSMGRRLVLAAALGVVAAACGSTPSGPDPATIERVGLDGIPGLPALDIDVPRFVRPTQLEGVTPVVYMFTGGSLRLGLLAHITIGANPHPGSGLTRLPLCRGTVTHTALAGHPAEVCDEPRGRATTVVYPEGDLFCRTTWTSDDRSRWRAVIAALDAACGTLRRR